jgi:hypothetical protein
MTYVNDQRGTLPCSKTGRDFPQVRSSRAVPTQRKVHDGRVQYACIRNVECRHLELLKHDFAVGGSIPGGFGDEDRMILRIAMEDLFQRVAKQIRNTLEVGDFGDEQKRPFSSLHARRKRKVRDRART